MIAIPTLLLALLTALKGRNKGWWTPLALLLSAAGDLSGSLGAFIPQMGLFALALGCYIADLAPSAKLTRQRLLPALLPPLAGLLVVAYLVAKIPSTLEIFLVGGYALVLLSMATLSLLQVRAGWGWLVAAALLFTLSDGLIGYSRYLASSPLADGWILWPYYAAQLIFAWRYWVR